MDYLLTNQPIVVEVETWNHSYGFTIPANTLVSIGADSLEFHTTSDKITTSEIPTIAKETFAKETSSPVEILGQEFASISMETHSPTVTPKFRDNQTTGYKIYDRGIESIRKDSQELTVSEFISLLSKVQEKNFLIVQSDALDTTIREFQSAFEYADGERAMQKFFQGKITEMETEKDDLSQKLEFLNTAIIEDVETLRTKNPYRDEPKEHLDEIENFMENALDALYSSILLDMGAAFEQDDWKMQFTDDKDGCQFDITYNGVLCCQLKIFEDDSVWITDEAYCGYENHELVSQAVIQAMTNPESSMKFHILNSSDFFEKKASAMQELYDYLCDEGYIEEGNPSFDEFDESSALISHKKAYEAYEGGLDSNGHEQKDNFSVQESIICYSVNLDGSINAYEDGIVVELLKDMQALINRMELMDTDFELIDYRGKSQPLVKNAELAEIRKAEKTITEHFNGDNWNALELEEFLGRELDGDTLEHIESEIAVTLSQMPDDELKKFAKLYAEKDNPQKSMDMEKS